VNHRTTSIYFEQDCEDPYTIEIQGVQHDAMITGFDVACSHPFSAGVDCYPFAWQIPAGESADLQWPGILYEPTAMPAECYGDGAWMASDTCARGTAASPGPMRVIIDLYGAVFEGQPQYDSRFTASADFVSGQDQVVDVVVQ
jgi:hypothetical protein